MIQLTVCELAAGMCLCVSRDDSISGQLTGD